MTIGKKGLNRFIYSRNRKLNAFSFNIKKDNFYSGILRAKERKGIKQKETGQVLQPTWGLILGQAWLRSPLSWSNNTNKCLGILHSVKISFYLGPYKKWNVNWLGKENHSKIHNHSYLYFNVKLIKYLAFVITRLIKQPMGLHWTLRIHLFYKAGPDKI